MPRLRYLKRLPNMYGQPGVTLVEVDHAGEDWGDVKTGDAGVALETFMSETFLSPTAARALAYSLLFCANVAEGKDPPSPRCGWCEAARKQGVRALPHECELTVPLGEVLSA